MKQKLIAVLIICIAIFCNTAYAQQSCGTVTDIDGHIYNTVQIGSQCWMRENLHATHFPDGKSVASFAGFSETSGKAYYYSPIGKPDAYVYGHLYSWEAAMHVNGEETVSMQGICPDGWHVPSAAEWQQLADYVGSQKQFRCSNEPTFITRALAGKKAWENKSSRKCCVGSGSGTNNATGFSAIPTGLLSNQLYNFGNGAYFWSSTPHNGLYAHFVGIYHEPTLLQGDMNKEIGLSVRCLRNDSPISDVETNIYNVGDSTHEENSDNETADFPRVRKPQERAQFPGGMDAMRRFLMENTQYPVSAREAGIQGVVILEVVISKNGSINDIRVLHGVCKELDDEAIRVVKMMPKWESATDANGQPVNCTLNFPFIFTSL